jgi:hypothetical protein
MKYATLLLAIALSLIALPSAFAWTPQWGPVVNTNTGYYFPGQAMNGYQTASARSSWNYAQGNTFGMSPGLGTSYSQYNQYGSLGGNAYDARYAERTGPYLTAPGYYAAPKPALRYEDPVYRGAYSGFTGQYYNTFSNTVQNQNPYQRTSIPARRYPDPRYVTSEWQ